ncbi:TPA: hypothetical protein ACMVBZ_000267 [Clostridioides difficile]|uniref:hypothetical protein n=1 Tax=Clostridioides difficile TaxID=1496 RepID=UPI00130438FE|nr:hypothetical protein [Clostridioides difficile]EJX3465466.1 hypothetical protein [Clostridioides difficile]MBY2483433.1 hypothetical protein [Clostridioides difficile]
MNCNDKSKATFLFCPVRTKEDYKRVLASSKCFYNEFLKINILIVLKFKEAMYK